MKNRLTYLILPVVFFIASCNTEGLSEIPMEQFIGTWSLQGRGMFAGMEIDIKEEDGKLIGRLTKLNENKYIQFFATRDDVWVREIKRSSNYQFEVTEEKIARELFVYMDFQLLINSKFNL